MVRVGWGLADVRSEWNRLGIHVLVSGVVYLDDGVDCFYVPLKTDRPSLRGRTKTGRQHHVLHFVATERRGKWKSTYG